MLLCLLILTGLFAIVGSLSDCTGDQVCTLNDSSMRFFVLGDFGGLPVVDVTIGQERVATSLMKIGDSKNTDFQIELGDNFYFTGVQDIYDDRFQETFEKVYRGKAMYKPWYVIAGNHDHFGNVSAQVAYSKVSRRWVFPSLYYIVNYRLSDGTTVEFVMIDTIELCGNTRDVENVGFFGMLSATKKDPTGPDDVAQAEKQWQWIEDKLRTSSADYLFVAGHYPVYSIASHGPTKLLVERLRPMLHKYKVNAYFSGHDHSLQHLEETDDGWTTTYVVSGAASRMDRSTEHEDNVPQGALKFHYPTGWNPLSQLGVTGGAFAYVDLKKCGASFAFFKGKGEYLYNFDISPRNNPVSGC